jgi:hypothetical protein
MERSFKEKLQLSPEFFRLFLIADKNKLINNSMKLIDFLEDRDIMNREYNPDSNNRMAITGTTFDINRIFKACVWMDICKKQCNEESIEYLKQTKNEISEEERMKGYMKYVRTIKESPDVKIMKLRREVIKSLNQIKKELSNTEIEELKKSNHCIASLRLMLRNYITTEDS